MKWIVRHSERIDFDIDKWEKHKRFKENRFDSPITNKGKKIARQAGEEIIKNDKNIDDITYIYCSPFTRCIETALEIQKMLEKKLKKVILLRIEYGISETNFIRYCYELQNFKELKNNKLVLNIDKNELIYLDDKLKISNLLKVHKNKIDKSYKSFTKFKDMKYLDSNPLKGWDKRMKAFGHIWDLEKNNTYIIVSHGNAIKDGIGYILKNLDFKGIENFRWESWCILTGFKENKLVYEPSIDFWNK